jgi:hypothetical protein
MFFHSYKEAHEKLHIRGSYQRGTIGNDREGITSLKLTENPKSYDRIQNDLERIWYVGKGKKSSQGEPAESQTIGDQAPFFRSLELGNDIPILMKLKPSLVIFLGYYRVAQVRNKKTKKNIQYFEIELHRVRLP